MKFKIEQQTYPYLDKYFSRRGFKFQRIESNTSVPDTFTYSEDHWYWVEVKMYRGKKEVLSSDFSADDLKWQPGQMRFRKEMIDKGRKRNYLLVVCKEDCFYYIIGGLDRC